MWRGKASKYLAVAVLNNLAHIHYMLQDLKKASRMFDLVMHLLHTERHILTGTKELVAFFLNQMVLKNKNIAPAPAA